MDLNMWYKTVARGCYWPFLSYTLKQLYVVYIYHLLRVLLQIKQSKYFAKPSGVNALR